MNAGRTTPLTIRRLLGAVVMFAAALGLWRVALAEDRAPAGWLPASLAIAGAVAFAGGTGIVFRRSMPLIAAGFAAPAFLIAVDRIWQLLLGRELPGRALYLALAVALACLLLGAAWLPIKWWKRAAAALALLVLLAIEIFVLAMLSLAWGGMEGVTSKNPPQAIAALYFGSEHACAQGTIQLRIVGGEPPCFSSTPLAQHCCRLVRARSLSVCL